MMKHDIVLWFKDLGKEDIPLVGGKCANLGELYGKIGVNVPDGFAISAYAYQVFLEKNRADEKIASLLAGINMDDLGSVPRVSHQIRMYIEGLSMPEEIRDAILKGIQRPL